MSTTITAIDRATVKQLHVEIDAALEAIATKHGLTYTSKSASYTSSSFKASGEFSVAGAKSTTFARMAKVLRGADGQPMFTEDDFGRTFSTGGHTYTITDINLKAPRFPINATREDGKGFKFPAEMVKALLLLSKASA